MEVVYYKILKIDNEAGQASFASFENVDNIQIYVMNILNKCASAPTERRYKFCVNKQTTKQRIENLIKEIDIEGNSLELGNDLAKVEMNSNIAHAQLKGKIPIGILLIALADMQTDEDDYKLILIKSDYDEFIAEGTGTQSSGLSIKNQIFKTCIYNIKKQDNGFTWDDITASDSTKRSASYWHSTFLELEECISDKDNTINAFHQIKSKILTPIKKDHKPDYLVLYNATVGYMRQAGVFNLDYYKNNIIGLHTPFDVTLNIDELKDKVEKLRRSGKFDATFTKVPDEIKDKLKDYIRLTNEIDLKIKQDVAGIENVILKADLVDGRKGITIVSQEGYEYAKGLERP